MSSNKIINKLFIEKCSKLHIDTIYARLAYAVNIINHTYVQYDMCSITSLNEIDCSLQSVFNSIKFPKFTTVDDIVIYLTNNLEDIINKNYRNIATYILEEICYNIARCDDELDKLNDIKHDLESICTTYIKYPFYEYIICHIMNFNIVLLNKNKK